MMKKLLPPWTEEATEFVESSSRSCIYVFWNGSEASIRGMDWTSDSSLEELLQSRNQPSSNFNDWIYDSTYRIHSVPMHSTPFRCHTICYWINIRVPWRCRLEHCDSSKCDEDSDS
jgi:hypothetical protein